MRSTGSIRPSKSSFKAKSRWRLAQREFTRKKNRKCHTFSLWVDEWIESLSPSSGSYIEIPTNQTQINTDKKNKSRKRSKYFLVKMYMLLNRLLLLLLLYLRRCKGCLFLESPLFDVPFVLCKVLRVKEVFFFPLELFIRLLGLFRSLFFLQINEMKWLTTSNGKKPIERTTSAVNVPVWLPFLGPLLDQSIPDNPHQKLRSV